MSLIIHNLISTTSFLCAALCPSSGQRNTCNLPSLFMNFSAQIQRHSALYSSNLIERYTCGTRAVYVRYTCSSCGFLRYHVDDLSSRLLTGDSTNSVLVAHQVVKSVIAVYLVLFCTLSTAFLALLIDFSAISHFYH